MKRVAWLFPSFGGGGVQRSILRLTPAFLERGLAVDLVVVEARGPFLKDVPPGANVTDLRASGTLAALPRIIAYLRTVSPDALISAQNHVNLVAALAFALARPRTRLFLAEHNDMLEGGRRARGVISRLRPLAARILYPLAEGIIATSRGVAESVSIVARIPSTRIHTIYNPALPEDLERLVGSEPGHPWLASKDMPVILAVGRLALQKDFPSLLQAFAHLRTQVPARLIILGEGTQRRHLEDLAQGLGIASHVSMPGFNENPYAYMARADVFVLSSVYEGFANVLVEALACGARVVSTNCRSGPAEILDGGRFGRMVPIRDAPALARAIQDALEDKSFHREQSIRRAAEFSTARSAEAYLKLLFPGEIL